MPAPPQDHRPPLAIAMQWVARITNIFFEHGASRGSRILARPALGNLSLADGRRSGAGVCGRDEPVAAARKEARPAVTCEGLLSDEFHGDRTRRDAGTGPEHSSPLRDAAERGSRRLGLFSPGPRGGLAGTDGLIGLSIAAALCTVPGLIVFGLAAAMRGPSQGVVIALGGTALRLVFVLVGALAVQAVQPRLRFREFFVWLLAYYLILLAAETLLFTRKLDDGVGPGSGSK